MSSYKIVLPSKEIRRIVVNNQSYASLFKKISEEIIKDQFFTLGYEDSDGDLVTVSSDEELQAAKEFNSSKSSGILRLVILKSSSAQVEEEKHPIEKITENKTSQSPIDKVGIEENKTSQSPIDKVGIEENKIPQPESKPDKERKSSIACDELLPLLLEFLRDPELPNHLDVIIDPFVDLVIESGDSISVAVHTILALEQEDSTRKFRLSEKPLFRRLIESGDLDIWCDRIETHLSPILEILRNSVHSAESATSAEVIISGLKEKARSLLSLLPSCCSLFGGSFGSNFGPCSMFQNVSPLLGMLGQLPLFCQAPAFGQSFHHPFNFHPRTPYGSSSEAPKPSSDASSDVAVHTNVTCDGCGMSPLRGIRMKCTICEDFDLCSDCDAKSVSNGGLRQHSPSHPMIQFREPFVRSPPKPEEVVHENVSCDSCQMLPIRGPRFRCTQCENFDLCGTCEKNKVTVGSHNASHPLLLMRQPIRPFHHGGHGFWSLRHGHRHNRRHEKERHHRRFHEDKDQSQSPSSSPSSEIHNPYAPPSTDAPADPISNRYAQELEMLASMGFTDRASNIQKLDLFKGDVERVIAELLM